MKMKYFPNYRKLSPETTKEIYREYSKKYHPDKDGGNSAIMSEINTEYDLVKKYYQKRVERQKLLSELITKIEQKTIEGINAVKPDLEPELKKIAKEKASDLIEKKIPGKYTGIAKIILTKIISDADLTKITRAGFNEMKNLLTKNKNGNENV